MPEITTVRVPFSSVADVRAWFAERYFGMPLDEKNIARTCVNHGLVYVPPLEFITDPPGEIEKFFREVPKVGSD